MFNHEPTVVAASYRVYQAFGQNKLGYCGLLLGSSQFLLMTKRPPKMLFTLKVAKSDSK